MASDWEADPTIAWNYAVVVSDQRLDQTVVVVEREAAGTPFSAKGAMVELHVSGCRVPQWSEHEGSAGPLPAFFCTYDYCLVAKSASLPL